ncbi:FAD-dependent oxidoreductase [Affinirhizobium pseudoryzae]|uniref:FAD-dependent oxidoreductase n=1 Tax=Allorhizobium pseudoryzae TaxID=379684 RepID=UPI0013EC63DE|nr:FAD-dependent oxidoreductase [Allorhizobium pseudoryzae]
MALLHTREYQMFPVLTPSQIATAQRFASGDARRFSPGAVIYQTGDRLVPLWLVIDGSMTVYRQNGLSGQTPITTHGTGQLSGEIDQLSGRPTLAKALAGPLGCTALPFDAAHLRALMIGSADVGEIIMRALILRRTALIDAGAGSVLVGSAGTAALSRLQGFLARNAYPYTVLDAANGGDGKALIDRLGIQDAEMPVMVCPNGTILRNPSDAEAARHLGMTPDPTAGKIYDVAVVGAGPAGLATAVYAASEGLGVIVFEERFVGGQAGASSRIENYLGFPAGISGQELAERASRQALKFGAELLLPVAIESLSASYGAIAPLSLMLAGGTSVYARTVVIASGARYRRPGIAGLKSFEDGSVSYWASPIEAKLCSGQDVVLVGGGNSAGQAVAFLAPQVRRLHLVVRRPLEETMSQYLIDRIHALPNVVLHVHCEVVALEGDAPHRLASAVIRSQDASSETRLPLHHLFLFVGADPNSGWLPKDVITDSRGFIVTGQPFGEGAKPARAALPLETSLPNVFAIGDVRSSSTKRVAAAVGEGAAVVSQIHTALRDEGTRHQG